MPATERRVLGWLRNYSAPGIAIAGCNIPQRRGRTSYEADLVVITPETCAVIEVKGLTTDNGGQLNCPANGRWNIDNLPDDPVHVRKGDTSPLDQVTGRMYDLKHLTEQAGGQGLFIAGLVLVIPRNAEVTLNKGPMPTGRDVLLGNNPAGLLGWLRAAARRREAPWTAELVVAVLKSLGITDTTISYEQLLAQGFPTHRAPDLDPYRPDIAAPWEPLPPAAVYPTASEPTSTGRTVITNPDLGRTDSRTDDYTDYIVPFAAQPAKHGGRTPARSALLAVAVFGALIGGLWYITEGRSSEASDPAPTTNSITEQSPAPEQAPAPAPALEPVTEAPPPPPAPAPKGCYPFQTNCG
ncbi:nuclease-related domain-containing protein [Nocardia brasiliensis]